MWLLFRYVMHGVNSRGKVIAAIATLSKAKDRLDLLRSIILLFNLNK